MADPLVSILMPAYNAERFIEPSIKSAVAQTWPRIETIIVDDGSTDDTLNLARQFESRSVKVESQINSGASAARNRALSMAQGDYIQWLDADDLLAPDKIDRQIVAARDDSPAVLFSSEFGTFFYGTEKASFVPSPLWTDLKPVDWITTKFSENAWMNPAVWLVSRQLCEAAGPWNEQLSLDDDGEYFCRMVMQCRGVRFVSGARSYYRQWSTSSLSRATSWSACRSLLQSLKLSIGYLLSLEDSERTRSAAVDYLQVWYLRFFPEKTEMLAEMRAMAQELGGCPLPPNLGWKYTWIKNLVGWKRARTVQMTAARARLRLRSGWDRVAASCSRKV